VPLFKIHEEPKYKWVIIRTLFCLIYFVLWQGLECSLGTCNYFWFLSSLYLRAYLFC